MRNKPDRFNAGAVSLMYWPAAIVFVSVYGDPPVYPWTNPYDKSGEDVAVPIAPAIDTEIVRFGTALSANVAPVNRSM